MFLMSENNIKNLKHVTETTKMGGEILVLDTGPVIGAEETAMLQALHSRSLGGIREHLETLQKRGAEKFMSSFYVGYGHKSIGDCGTTTIFIENVSMLAAKAIQDWPLYSGQEASTRYIQFEKQKFLNPNNSEKGNKILEKWRSFYVKNMSAMVEKLKQNYPIEKNQSENIYEKAIAARAFDIMRSFLPAGATTNLAWHTNLRQAADKIMLLRHHPLEEVRQLGDTIEKALQKAYPNSFGHKKYDNTEKYNFIVMKENYYHNLNSLEFTYSGNKNINLVDIDEKILTDRPLKTELPKTLNGCGIMEFEFHLDFGSFRDLQRHRAINQKMPLLTSEIGFENWYLEQLPKSVREEAKRLLIEQKKDTENLNLSLEETQYYLPMGYKISNKISGGLAALVYMIELRSTRFVHPTLVKVALKMADTLKKCFPKLILHIDKTPNQFDIRRGEHDIVDKNK